MRAFPECVDVTAGVGRFSGREMWEKAICVCLSPFEFYCAEYVAYLREFFCTTLPLIKSQQGFVKEAVADEHVASEE